MRCDDENIKIDENINTILKEEEDNGLLNIKKYKNLQTVADKIKMKFRFINQLKKIK